MGGEITWNPPVTTGGSIGNIIFCPPNYDNTIWWNTSYTQEPSGCIGKAHVFECDHVDKCKCGAIQRVMPKPSKAKKR